MRRLVFVALTAAIATAVAGCGDSGDEDGATGAAEVAQALCEASALAGGGEVDDATEAFHDVHGDLHTIADGLADTDRQAAANLLRTKQQVEDDVDGDDEPSTSKLAADLRALAVAVADASGDDPPSCP